MLGLPSRTACPGQCVLSDGWAPELMASVFQQLQGLLSHFSAVSLFCMCGIGSQLLFHPEVSAGARLTDASAASCPDAHGSLRLHWRGSQCRWFSQNSL